MRRLVAVVLVVGAVLWARRIDAQSADDPRTTGIALGLTLIVAFVTGELLRRFKLPRLTGYLLFGLLTGPYLAGLITERMAGQLQAVTGLATTLIALIAGLMINLKRLGPRLAAPARLMLTTVGVSIAVLFALVWIGWELLPVAAGASGLAKLSMALLLVICVVSFSPTMTAAVIAETGARGRLSDLVLLTVVLADIPVLVLFSLAMQLARFTLGSGAVADDVSVIVRLAWEIGGAIAMGSLVGAVFALYLRYVGREVTLVLLAVCALLSQVGATQKTEPLLAALVAGLVIGNLAVAQGDALKAAVQRGALPVLVIFFVAVGSSLRLDALVTVGAVAVALAALRLAVVRIGVLAGLQASGIEATTGRYVWTGLVSQAGITLGLAAVIAAEFPDWGRQIQILIVALIVMHELVGPILFRFGLQRAGDLGPSESRPLVVVSNREPYLHRRREDDGAITYSAATGGVAVALDALMRERGGTWIAHGAGPADREVVDARDKVRVPPDAPAYELRRLWLADEQFSAYYGGFANEGLWPLCHQVDVRPQFRAEDWVAYQAVNAQFAAAIDQELSSTETPVFIQDYHLAVVAPRLRERRPSARMALFWHIPWPHPDRLRICPWAREILAGLLANDLLAFQLERDRRNFLQAVGEELEAEVEADGARVLFEGRSTSVVSVPIGVDYDRIQAVAQDGALAAEQRRLVEAFGLQAEIVGVGVDRLDYTKGIPERLAALDRLLTERPELRGRITFVQIGVPSRSELASYNAIEAEIDRGVAEVNQRHRIPGRPPPIYYFKSALKLPSLVALYRLAQFCVVSSLHDGMNLVAKEFVAARDDEDGVLVLSGLAGAAQELQEALVINPYDVGGFADALARAIDMPREERRQRMRAMRRTVAGRNVFGWASDILEGLESLWTAPLQYAARGPEDTPV